MLLVVLVLAVSYASSTRAWLRQRSEINAFQAAIVQRQAAVAALERDQRRWHDPAYIKEQARLRFGWVMPGETGYRVIDAHGNLLSDGSDQLAQTRAGTGPAPSQWWQAEWGTVVQAGKDPAADSSRWRPVRTPARRIGGHHGQGNPSGR